MKASVFIKRLIDLIAYHGDVAVHLQTGICNDEEVQCAPYFAEGETQREGDCVVYKSAEHPNRIIISRN